MGTMGGEEIMKRGNANAVHLIIATKLIAKNKW